MSTCTHPHHSPVWRFLQAGLILVGVGLLGACMSLAQQQKSAADSAQIAELTSQLDASRSSLAESQKHIEELQGQIARLNAQLLPLQGRADKDQARIKELEDTKTHLEDLLTRLQMLRLNGLMQSIPSGDSQASDPSPQPTATAPAPALTSPSPTATPRPTSLPPTDLSDAPTSSLDLPASTTAPAEGQELVLQGSQLKGRKDRKAIRGTPLISERDSANGNLKYYHRDFWYDKPGIFIEITATSANRYSAGLIVQSKVAAKETSDNFGKLVFVKSADPAALDNPAIDFGFPGLRNYLQNSEEILESLVYDLDSLTVSRLLEALGNPKPLWTIQRSGQQTEPPQELNPSTRRALLEMIQAFADLRNAPTR